VGELQTLIPDALAAARCAGVSPLTLADLKDPKEYGRLLLATDAVKALEASDACDVRGAEGKKEIRLVVPAGAAAVAAPPASAAAGGKDVVVMTANGSAPSAAAVRLPDVTTSPADVPAVAAS